MSNNAAVCPSGGEIGRAQYAQAMAAGIEPTVDMNPILLKPQSGACQVIVRGKLAGTLGVAGQFRRQWPDHAAQAGEGPACAEAVQPDGAGEPGASWLRQRSQAAAHGPGTDLSPETPEDLWPVVTDALDRLRGSYDLIVAEGAGSPAEINLRDRDVVNMRVARYANADVILIADIDKGGAFAALLGTWEWLDPAERALVRGFILNRFRGDPALLAPAPALLEQRTGVPVLGVIPYIEDLRVAEEDAANLTPDAARADCAVEIAVVRLPHLANFDEFHLLAAEPGVRLTYVSRPQELRAPDLVILPGTKATIPDLVWLTSSGLADRVRWLAGHGTPVLGVCGGFQMLGQAVRDPLAIESKQVEAPGLGLLAVETELTGHKHLERVQGSFATRLPGIWQALSGIAIEGYEIHVGVTRRVGCEGVALLSVGGRHEGVVATSGGVAGTCVHGLFEQPVPCATMIASLAAARGYTWRSRADWSDPYEALADTVEATVRLDLLGR
jgi:adenosylcobyric acid synthase